MYQTATMSRNGSNLSRGGALDLLRFVAALFIVLYHVAERAPVSLFAIHPAFGRGYLATDFFLMLSGYVLARTYGPRVMGEGVATGAFLKRRLLRIWPPHLVMLALFVAFVLLTGAVGLTPQNPQWFQWDQLLPQVFLMQSWFVPGPSGWNMPTWTLSALIVCYAGFPTAWRAVAKVRSPWAALAAGVAIFLVVDYAAKALTGIPAHQLPLRLGLVRGIPLFVVGMLVARLPTTIAPRTADILAILSGVGVIALQAFGHFDHASLALLSLLIYAAGASGAKGWGWAATAGRLSFALFLTNQLTAVVWFGLLRAVERKLGLEGSTLWAAWAMALPVCVIAAWLFERFVDAPLQVWIKGWSRKASAPKREPVLA